MRFAATLERLSGFAGRGLALALALGIVASACGTPAAAPAATAAPAASAAPASAAAATPAPTPSSPPVVVNYGGPSNILNAAFYVGVEKGIYLKNGIDLKITTTASGPDAIKGMQGGQFNISPLSWSTLVPVYVQGVPFKLFAPVSGNPNVVNYDNPLAIIVRDGLPATTSIATLKGLTIGTAFGGAPEVYLRTQLKNAGLDPDKDVKLVNVGFPNQLSALQTKSADAVVSTEPYGTQMLKTVTGSRLIVRGGGYADNRTSIGALQPWVAANGPTIEKIVKAHAEASQYARQNPAEAAKATAVYLTGIDVSILEAALKVVDLDPRWSDKIRQSFDQASQTLIGLGTIKAPAPKPEDILMLDVLNGIATKYPQYFTDVK